jgi:TonB family protein
MKKEKLYSFVYALVLGLILISTSISAQYASLDSRVDFDKKFVTLSTETEGVTATEKNIAAIEEISFQIKKELNFLKEQLNLQLTGEALLEVKVNADGEITNAKVTRGGNYDLNVILVDIVKDLKKVSPVVVNGIPQARVLWIPIKFKN